MKKLSRKRKGKRKEMIERRKRKESPIGYRVRKEGKGE
jgi:hypothetical protein